jgi:hypothetical protein
MNLNYVTKKINLFLSKPYPSLLIQKDRWLYICVVTIVLALLINLEQPFGLHAWEHPYKWLILSGFGCTYAFAKSLYLIFSPRLFPNTFNISNWTIGKEIISIIFTLIGIGVLNWIHALATITDFTVSWSSFLLIQRCTLIFGILPAFTFALFVQIRNLKSNKLIPNKLCDNTNSQHTDEKSIIVHINEKPFFVNDILYINAKQNYVEIHFMCDGNKQKHFCRITIKLLETKLESFPQIKRCHKSYLVNIAKIVSWKGNSGNIKLQIEYCTEKIQVSRKYVPLLKDILQKEN